MSLTLLIGCQDTNQLEKEMLKANKKEQTISTMTEISFNLIETLIQADQYFDFHVDGLIIRSLDELNELNEEPHRVKVSADNFDEEYFNNNILLVIGFIHSSSEKEISISKIELNKENKIVATINVNSNYDELDGDIWSKVFILEVDRNEVLLSESIEIFISNILYPGINRSGYYGKK